MCISCGFAASRLRGRGIVGIGLGLLVSGLVLKYPTVRIRLHREVTIKLGVQVVKEA